MRDPRIWLRTHRASHDQTQTEAAQDVGVSRHTWARWERGDLVPGLDQACALARWAGVRVDEVADGFGLLDAFEVEPLTPPGALDHRGRP